MWILEHMGGDDHPTPSDEPLGWWKTGGVQALAKRTPVQCEQLDQLFRRDAFVCSCDHERDRLADRWIDGLECAANGGAEAASLCLADYGQQASRRVVVVGDDEGINAGSSGLKEIVGPIRGERDVADHGESRKPI